MTAVDKKVDLLVLPEDKAASVHSVAAGLQRLLARGAKPTALVLDQCGLDKAWAALTAFRAAPQQLQSLVLGAIPLNPDMTSALKAAAPQLSKFFHTCTDLATKAGGLPAVLAQLAPHLEHLTLGSTAGFAPALATPLRDCTRLTSLILSRYAFRSSMNLAHMLEPLACLPQLRSLSVVGCEAASCAPALAPLTRLTRLVWTALVEDSTAAALPPVVAQLRNLAELRLVVEGLRAADLCFLSGLTCLTTLELARIEDHPDDGAPAPPRTPLQLPPLLQELEVYLGASPAAIQALQMPPSLNLVGLQHGLFPGSLDAEGRLGAAEAEALVVACGKLAGKLDSREGFQVRLPDGAKPPAAWAESGWAPLMAALGQLRLRHLALVGPASLATQDVAALTRHLGTLEALKLGCAVPLTALHWLSRLDRLRRVVLYPMKVFDPNDYEGARSCRQAVCLAVLPLCASAPRLREVMLDVEGDGDDRIFHDRLCDAADDIRKELHVLGRESVQVLCDREDSY